MNPDGSQSKGGGGALFLVCHRHGDDRRGAALFRLSGSDEALAAEVDRNAGPVVAEVGVGVDGRRVGSGISRAGGMKWRLGLVWMGGEMREV